MGLLEFNKLPINTLVGADWKTFKAITAGRDIDAAYLKIQPKVPLFGTHQKKCPTREHFFLFFLFFSFRYILHCIFRFTQSIF